MEVINSRNLLLQAPIYALLLREMLYHACACRNKLYGEPFYERIQITTAKPRWLLAAEPSHDNEWQSHEIQRDEWHVGHNLRIRHLWILFFFKCLERCNERAFQGCESDAI
jgi:hypothetical protein